jgi:hypothetical protein
LNGGQVQHYIIIKIIPTAKKKNLHYVNFTGEAYNNLSAGEKYIFLCGQVLVNLFVTEKENGGQPACPEECKKCKEEHEQ